MLPLEKPKSHKLRIITIIVIIIAVLTYGVWYKLFREVDPYYASDLDNFKYGTVGTEAQQGMPFWIFMVLPRMFPEYLPDNGGWASLGLPIEDGAELPVGFSKVTVGIERVGINCAFCHTATWREAAAPPEDPKGTPGPEEKVKTHIVPGGPSAQFNVQGYQDFLWKCAEDTRFNSRNIMAQIDRITKLSFIDRMLYKYVIISATRKALLKQKEQFSWTGQRPRWLHGRVDPFNGVKYAVLKVPMDDTIGNSDMPAVWNQKARGPSGFARHWDGLNPDLKEVVISSSIGDGSTLKWLDKDLAKWDGQGENRSSLRRIYDWLMEAPVPPYPFPYDKAVAEKGKAIFTAQCADCHAFGGKKTGTIIPAEEVGTDTHRLAMWTAESVTNYNNLAAAYPWKMNSFVKNNGYAAVPLDGVWLRGPYLHNGSVPTLADLLKPAAERPKTFYRGYNVIDKAGVGFDSTSEQAKHYGSLVDTSVPGNGNGGHLWGVNLPEDQKKALVEYMKSL
jgi:mono/diheme cytochrome c family protein